MLFRSSARMAYRARRSGWDMEEGDPMETAGETRFVEMVFPDLVNHYGTLFGGHALRLMDMAAFVAASRYTRQTVVTAAMDRVDFHAPVHQGQLLDVEGSVTATGKTSVTVEVTLQIGRASCRERV